MTKIKDFIRNKKLVVASGIGAVGTFVPSVLAHADDTATANVALTNAAQNAVNQATANINGVLPIALGLMGVVLAITIGIRVFKKVTKAGANG